MMKITFTDYIDETLINGTVMAIEARTGKKPDDMSDIEFIANDYVELIKKQKQIDVDAYIDISISQTRQDMKETLAPAVTKPEITIE